MSIFFCDDCKIDMKFDHTDYYDFDIYKCPKCGHEGSIPADGYGSPDDYDDDDDEEDFGYDDDQDYDYSTCACAFCGCSIPVSTPGDVCNDCRAGAHQG